MSETAGKIFHRGVVNVLSRAYGHIFVSLGMTAIVCDWFRILKSVSRLLEVLWDSQRGCGQMAPAVVQDVG